MIGFDPYAYRQRLFSALQRPQQQIVDYGGIGITPHQGAGGFPTPQFPSVQLPGVGGPPGGFSLAPGHPSNGPIDFGSATPTPMPQHQPQPTFQPGGGSGMPSQWPGLNPWAQEFGAGNTMATLAHGNPYAGFFNAMAGNTTPMYYGDPNQMNQTASYGGIAQHIANARAVAAAQSKANDPRANSSQGGGLPGGISPGGAAAGVGLGALALGNPYAIPLAGAAAGGAALWNWLKGGDDPPRYKTDPNASAGSNTRPASSGPSGAGSSSGAGGPTNRN